MGDRLSLAQISKLPSFITGKSQWQGLNHIHSQEQKEIMNGCCLIPCLVFSSISPLCYISGLHPHPHPCLGNVAAHSGLGLHRLTQSRQPLLKALFPSILGCVNLTELSTVPMLRHLKMCSFVFHICHEKKSHKIIPRSHSLHHLYWLLFPCFIFQLMPLPTPISFHLKSANGRR